MRPGLGFSVPPASGGGGVQAAAALAFLNSMGVNTHMGVTTNNVGVLAALNNIGIKYVRDQTWAPGIAGLNYLAANGVMVELLCDPFDYTEPQNVTVLTTFVAANPGMLSAVEGPNEYNNEGTTWPGGGETATLTGAAAAIEWAESLWASAQSSLSGIPVYNISVAYEGSTAPYTALGNLSAYCNYANAHSYTDDNGYANSPQVAFFGVPTTASQAVAPSNPMVITETGAAIIGSSSGYAQCSATVQAKLALCTFCDAWADGFVKCYWYDLIDDASGGETFGLYTITGSGLTATYTAKTSATALSNLTTILADSAAGSPGKLAFTVSGLPTGSPNYGNYFLLQKSTGEFDLVIWIEPQMTNTTNGDDLSNPTVDVTVTFGSSHSSVEWFDPMIGTTAQGSYSDASSITVGLVDHPLIIRVTG